MSVVFDSGVLVSAFQFGGTPLYALRRAFVHDQIAYCDQILDEITAVLMRKFQWQAEEIRLLLADTLTEGKKVGIEDKLHGVCRDPKDDMVFECAESAGAKCIVSGDQDVLAVRNYRGIHVLTPREYLEK